jgi:hypothetical protein
MMKNYMTTGASANGKKPEGDSVGKAAAPFLEEKVVMSIYGGPTPYESRCKLKLTSRVVNAISPATPKYLRWFESQITFDRTDHPSSIPKPRWFPLIVDPLVGMTLLTKALMDGGSSLNLMYLNTLKDPHPFYGVVLGKQSAPLGGSLCQSPSEMQATTTLRHSSLRWSISLVLTTLS